MGAFFSALFLAYLAFFMTACNTSHEGSLFSDELESTRCPQNSCVLGVADATETLMVLSSPVTNIMPVGSSLGEISGSCYPSLFPQNFIEVGIQNSGMQPLNVTSVLPPNFVARCNQGKFYIPINLQGQPAGNYTVNLQLVVVDENGQQIRPNFKTVSSTLVMRQ